MNNLEFIATYIHNNPDNATFGEIRMHLMLWKGHTVEDCMDKRKRGQYTTYFSKRYGYRGTLWDKDPTNRNSPYRLLEKGKELVVKDEQNDYNKNA